MLSIVIHSHKEEAVGKAGPSQFGALGNISFGAH